MVYFQIREGMTVVSNLVPSSYEETDRAVILKIFSSIGRCRFLEEKHFDACTALSGSGPAFACIFMEAMADGGVMMGLPRAEALELAAQSMSVSSLLNFTLIDTVFSASRGCPHGSPRWSAPCTDQGFCNQSVELTPLRLPFLVFTYFYSSWRMHNRWTFGFGRWESPINHCSRYPNCDRASQRIGTTWQEIKIRG